MDEATFGRKSYGNSVAIGKNLSKITELSPILARLTEKMCSRLRSAGYVAGGIYLSLVYKDGSFWHKGKLLSESHFDSKDFYKSLFRLLTEANPDRPVLNLAVSCFCLSKLKSLQLNIFEDVGKKFNLVSVADTVNEKWGDFTLSTARSFGGAKVVMDRIAFGGIKEL